MFVGSGGEYGRKAETQRILRNAPPGVASVALFDTTRENSPGPDTVRMDRLTALS